MDKWVYTYTRILEGMGIFTCNEYKYNININIIVRVLCIYECGYVFVWEDPFSLLILLKKEVSIIFFD